MDAENATVFRGNHVSDTTCLTQTVFRSGGICSQLISRIRQVINAVENLDCDGVQRNLDCAKHVLKCHGDYCIFCPGALFGSGFSYSISWQNSG